MQSAVEGWAIVKEHAIDLLFHVRSMLQTQNLYHFCNVVHIVALFRLAKAIQALQKKAAVN